MTNDLTVKGNTSLMCVEGLEDFEVKASDLLTPYAVVMQGLSKALKNNRDLKEGDLVNHSTGEKITGDFAVIKPMRKWEKIIKNKLEWVVYDKNDPRLAECEWGPNGEKPTAHEVLSFIVQFDDMATPCILEFKKTSYNGGRTLITKITQSLLGKAAVWDYKFHLDTVLKPFDGGDAYISKPRFVRNSTEEEKQRYAMIAQAFKSKKSSDFAAEPQVEDDNAKQMDDDLANAEWNKIIKSK